MSNLPEVFVNNDLLVVAFEEARVTDIAEFSAEQLEWLDVNSPIAHVAIQGFNARAEQQVARLGFAVGIDVVRKHIDAGYTDLTAVRRNHHVHFLDKQIADGGDIETDRLQQLFGPDAGKTMSEIKHPLVRNLSTVMLAASMNSNPSPEIKAYIKLPKMRVRSNGSRKISSRPR